MAEEWPVFKRPLLLRLFCCAVPLHLHNAWPCKRHTRSKSPTIITAREPQKAEARAQRVLYRLYKLYVPEP